MAAPCSCCFYMFIFDLHYYKVVWYAAALCILRTSAGIRGVDAGISPPRRNPPCINKTTRRFAPRAAYAARYAFSGRKNSVNRNGAMIDCKWKLATWKCQEARYHTPGNNIDATRTSIYRVFIIPGILIYLWCIHMPVSKLVVTTELLSLARRIGTDTGCAGLVLAECRWVEKKKTKKHSKQQHEWNMWL